MVLGFIGRFFKFLFSLLRKESSYWRHERGLESKEKRSLLEEEASLQYEGKYEKKLSGETLAIESLSLNLKRYVSKFRLNIEGYISTGKNDYLKNSEEVFHTIVRMFLDLHEELNHWINTCKELVLSAEEDKESAGRQKEEIVQENKLFRRNYKTVRRELRKKQNLDENVKFSNIKTRKEINDKLITLAEENLQIVEEELQEANKLKEETVELGKKFSNFLLDLHKKIKSWKKMRNLMKNAEKLIDEYLNLQNEKFLDNSVERTRQKFAIDGEINKLQEQERVLTRIYERTLEKEELSQQKGEEEIPKAA